MRDDLADDPGAKRRTQIQARLDAGEWLRVAEVAALYEVDRSTVLRWIHRDGAIRYHRSPAGGRAPLTCNPDDVRAVLAKLREEHGGTAVAGR